MDSRIIQPSLTIILLLIVLGAVGGYLYFSQIIKPDIQPPVIQLEGKEVSPQFKDLKLDFSLFDRKEFKESTIFGESPVKPGGAGKVDLFAPF
ncbi:MAG: hypothetical protein HYW77_02710 [Parcubacteria group bacterium]|nr:hypothetical protein [Parcubacteria group bacterium]